MANRAIHFETTSSNTIEVDPIQLWLSDDSTRRLVFLPLVIENNPKNPEANLKGVFVYQRKSKAGDWEKMKIDEESLSRLKNGEGYRLELNSESLMNLLDNVTLIKDIHKKYGFSYQSRTILINESNAEGIFLEIADKGKRDVIINNLKKLQEADFNNINAVLGLVKLDKVLDTWEDN